MKHYKNHKNQHHIYAQGPETQERNKDKKSKIEGDRQQTEEENEIC